MMFLSNFFAGDGEILEWKTSFSGGLPNTCTYKNSHSTSLSKEEYICKTNDNFLEQKFRCSDILNQI
jgi:hypothetical protein